MILHTSWWKKPLGKSTWAQAKLQTVCSFRPMFSETRGNFGCHPLSYSLFLLISGRHLTFTLQKKKKKTQVSLGWYSKSLITYKNTGVNVVGRDPSKKRTHLLPLFSLFQHPWEIIWNYQNSDRREHFRKPHFLCVTVLYFQVSLVLVTL